jgi:cytoskeletal protein CcmA (bactofilin family)
LFKKKKQLVDGMESFDTLVGKSSEIHGRMTVHDSIRIDGKVFGNLEPADKNPCSIAVGSSGVIEGNIQCHRAYIAGKVNGNIYAKELIVLSDTAVVCGDISSDSFNVASGAVVDGMMLQATRKLGQAHRQSEPKSNIPSRTTNKL